MTKPSPPPSAAGATPRWTLVPRSLSSRPCGSERPADERLEALSTLFESLDDEPEEPGWRQEWIDEIQRRIDGIRDGSRPTVSWDEARSYVLDRLRAVRG
jgi:putative addiction module component (TIGR02574 family)